MGKAPKHSQGNGIVPFPMTREALAANRTSVRKPTLMDEMVVALDANWDDAMRSLVNVHSNDECEEGSMDTHLVLIAERLRNWGKTEEQKVPTLATSPIHSVKVRVRRAVHNRFKGMEDCLRRIPNLKAAE